MTYHFRVHDDVRMFWAECVELEGCVTQSRNLSDLQANMNEALNLYLEERENSTHLFPPPLSGSRIEGTEAVDVEPTVAFALQLRQLRIRHKLTQKEAAKRLGMSSLYSYQRLERRSNPSLRTIQKIKELFPDFSLDSILRS